MITEQTIRQAVLNTINQVGCTGQAHVCWGLCKHTVTSFVPDDIEGEVSANREIEVFVNRVMYHVRAIEDKEIRDRIRRNAVMVDLDVLDDSYADGYATGANWKDTYIPGGPFHFSAGDHESDRARGVAAQSQAEHAAWMQGFYDGNGIQLNARSANNTHEGQCNLTTHEGNCEQRLHDFLHSQHHPKFTDH